jgi:hypothetical protein
VGADANRELVLRFLDEGVRQGKGEIFNENCSADLVNHASAPERRHRVQALKDVIAFSRRAQPDQRWTEQHVVAKEILLWCTGSARQRGNLGQTRQMVRKDDEKRN